MASAEMLRAAVNGGMDLGVHGFSHEPLDTVDVRDELDRAASVLRSISGTRPTTLSFPHGRYDDAAVADARELGFDLLFTSDPVLNRLAIGRTGPAADILGRIAITTAAVTRGPSAGLDPARLANWLINRAPVARSSR
jgi:peptidoglycan/xylan/chitin deacetylase (PgdA/CDA1 family)